MYISEVYKWDPPVVVQGTQIWAVYRKRKTRRKWVASLNNGFIAVAWYYYCASTNVGHDAGSKRLAGSKYGRVSRLELSSSGVFMRRGPNIWMIMEVRPQGLMGAADERDPEDHHPSGKLIHFVARLLSTRFRFGYRIRACIFHRCCSQFSPLPLAICYVAM